MSSSRGDKGKWKEKEKQQLRRLRINLGRPPMGQSSGSSPPSVTISPITGLHQPPSAEYVMIPTPGLQRLSPTSHTPHGTTYDSGSPTIGPSPSTRESPDTRDSNVEVTNQSNKTFVEPDGDFGFLPSKPAADAITKIIRSRYNQPWTSWLEIPKDTRKMWFREFQGYVWWMPQHQNHMRKTYNSRSSKRLSGLLGQARNLNERPFWIGEGIWEDLCRHWASSMYKEKCQQAKMNRASDTGGCLHTGGCISTGTHAQKLAKTLGREPTVDETFRHVHLRKEDRTAWVSTKAKDLYEEFKTKESEQSSQCSNEEGASGTQMTSRELWIKTVGGPKKGRVYGLGSQASIYDHGDSSSSRPMSTQVPEHVINQVKEQLQQEMLDRVQQIQQQMEQQSQQREAEWKMRFEQYQRQQNQMIKELKSYVQAVGTQPSQQLQLTEEDNQNSEDDHDEDDNDNEDY